MKKKLFSLMMMLLLAATGYVRADELTVHDGSGSSGYVPVWGLWTDNNLQCEFVYPASELSSLNGGDITGLKFYSTSTYTNVSWNGTYQVFVKEVDATTISSFTGTTGATVVYNGSLNVSSSIMEVTFNTPYHYNGGNLLVGVYYSYSGSYANCYWTGETVNGASIYGRSGQSFSANQANFLPKTTFSYTVSGGEGGEGGDTPVGPQPIDNGPIHIAYMDGDVEVDNILNLGTRPANAWMAPFEFRMYSTGPTYKVTDIDFTPANGLFTLGGEELPFQIDGTTDADLTLSTSTETSLTGAQEFRLVALTEGDRAAHIWPVVVDLYTAQRPDVWELACEDVNHYPFVEVPATAHNVTLHNDYTLPFPEIPEGFDAVYKIVITGDQVLNAEVTSGENGKVALYTEDFYGEDGPMATNNYVGDIMTVQEGGSTGGGTLTVHDIENPTASYYSPLYGFYFDDYTRSESVYPASELTAMRGQNINSMKFYVSSPGSTDSWGSANIQVYLKEVSSTTISAFEGTAGATLVYEGTMTAPTAAGDEFVITFTTPYRYNGGNLLVGTCNTTIGSWRATQWVGETVNGACICGSNSSSLAGVPATQRNFLPKTTFSYGNRDLNRDVILAESFESGLGNWTMSNCHSSTGVSSNYPSYAHEGSNTFCFYYTTNPPQYLISPMLTGTENGVDVSFWYTGYSTYYTETFQVGYSTTTNDVNAFTFVGPEVSLTVDGDWSEYTNSFPAGTKYVAVKHTAYDQFYLFVDDFTFSATSGPAPVDPSEHAYVAGPVIENLPVVAGTYYLVASSTDPDFEVTINAENMPCPEAAYGPSPADDQDSIAPASVTLRWNQPDYATEWRLVFGTTYYPNEDHPQTIVTDWSSDMNVNSYTVHNLWNNTNYFWRIEVRNSQGNNTECPAVVGPIWGFTTHLNVPLQLVAMPEVIYEGETTTLNWTAIVDRTFRQYNIYKDGEFVDNTTVTPNPEAYLSYVVPASELEYNPEGYVFNVTAVYDEGESAFSNDAIVKVGGYSAQNGINGYVYEVDGTTPIGGVTVTVTGTTEFGVDTTFSAITGQNGYYEMQVVVGEYTTAIATCPGYQDAEPYQNSPNFSVAHNAHHDNMNFILDELFLAPAHVCAEVVEVEGEELVKVWWDWNFFTTLTEDFEDWANTPYAWQNDAQYPWTLTTEAHEGTYALKSGNAGIGSSTSTLEVTVDIPQDGMFSFDLWSRGESTTDTYDWDVSRFYIDGQQKFQYGQHAGWETYSTAITAGTHTFRWVYKKDATVNPAQGDCFMIDNIKFVYNPEDEAKGMTATRALDHYRIYRTDCYNYGPYTAENTILLATAWVPDTAYFDVSWPTTAPGVYKWGVGVVYAGNNADNPNNGRESEIVWAEQLNKTVANVNSVAKAPVSQTEAIRGYVPTRGNATVILTAGDVWGDFDDSGYQMLIDADATAFGSIIQQTGPLTTSCPAPAGLYDNFEYKIPANADGDCATSNIVFNNSVSIEIPAGTYDWCITNPTAGDRIWIAAQNGNIGGRQNDYVFEEGKIYEFTVSYYSGNDGVDVTITEGTPVGPVPPTPGDASCDNELALPRESCTMWSDMCAPCIDKDMELDNVTVNVVLNSADSPEGTTVTFTNLNEYEQLYHPIDVLTLGETGYYAYETFRRGYYAVAVEHEGYYPIYDTVDLWTSGRDLRYVMTEILYPAKGLYVSRTGWAMWEPMTDADGIYPEDMPAEDRHLEYYKVMCTSVDGEPIFNTDTEHPFCQLATDELVEGEHYIVKVAVVYSTGVSMWRSAKWQYEPCENYAGTVDGVTVDGNTLSWTYPAGDNPGPQPEPTALTESFEGLSNNAIPATWTSIDADGDGYDWYTLNWIEAGWSENAAHTGDAFATSASYQGVALHPDNYLVSPQVTLGGTLSFWASAQDESWAAETFGVAVSTTGNTAAADFTTLQSWTLTAKSTGARTPDTRSGSGRSGAWYQYTVDLSAYAGQTGYIAIRHFNCSDQFRLNIDDVELGNGRSNRDELAYYFTNDLEGWTSIDADGDGMEWYHNSYETQLGHDGLPGMATSASYSGAVLYPDNYLVSPQVALGGTISFWANAQDAAYPLEKFGVAVSTNSNTNAADFTTLQSWTLAAKGGNGVMSEGRDGSNREQGNWYQYTVDLSAYAGQTGYVAIRHFDCYDQFRLNIDDVVITTGTTPTPTPGGNILGAMIFADGEWEAFVEYPTNTYTYEGDADVVCVRMVYDGMAVLPDQNFYYAMSCEECVGEIEQGCDAGDPIFAEAIGEQVHLWWGEAPVPPVPGENSFTESFDNDLNGWHVLDVNAGQGTWLHSTNQPYGHDYTGLAHSGAGFALCYSFVDYTGSFDTDSYLYTPQMYDIEAGSTLTFWADNANDDYPESFSVCVATAENPTAADFVQVWSGSAKEAAGQKAAYRHNANRYENWRAHSVDLSAFAGQRVWIAFHDVNYDMYEVWIDDVELSVGAKANRAEIDHYNVYRSEDNVDYALIGTVEANEDNFYEYFDAPGSGTYYYKVTAVYADGCESEAAVSGEDPTQDYVVVGVTGIGENDANVALFPNPTKGNVTIQAEGMNRITVVSVLGQVVFDTELSADEYTMNMAQFNAGMYLVRVYTENGMAVKRVTVMQ